MTARNRPVQCARGVREKILSVAQDLGKLIVCQPGVVLLEPMFVHRHASHMERSFENSRSGGEVHGSSAREQLALKERVRNPASIPYNFKN